MFELPLQHATLRVVVNAERWSVWTLVAEDRSIRLGADTFDRIARRIVARLAQQHEPAGFIDDRSVHWVCSFAEDHHTIYCAWTKSRRELYFQDAAANVVWRDTLAPTDLEQWSVALSAG
jgi:hypothetical protein